MVKTEKTVIGPDPITEEFDEGSHIFMAIKPKFGTNGMPDSCTKCHTPGGRASRSTNWNITAAQRVFDMTNASVRNISSTYIGADFCKICHTDTVGIPQVYNGWNTTRHSSAFNRKFLPQVLNASGNDSSVRGCVPCHTVGFNKGGYINFNTTPQLINIQCENCHGRGSKHEIELNISAFVCGECHQGVRRPTITEWEQARHARAKDRFNGTNAAIFTRCLECHSGDFRLARNRALIQDATNTTRFGVTCAVCHDSHSAVNPRQLRAPTPTLMCSQCHSNYDARGPGFVEPIPEIRAMTPDAPHNFQVEMRQGIGGINVTSIPFMPGVGCSDCHMFTRGYISTADPAITGHTFVVNTTVCKECHVTASGENDTLLRHNALGILKPGRFDCGLCHERGFSAQGFIDTWQLRIGGEINRTQANVTLARNAATTSALLAAFNRSKFNLDIVNASDKTRGVHNPFYASAVLTEANRVANQVISGTVVTPLPPEVVPFDLNSNGIIERIEAVNAVVRFFGGDPAVPRTTAVAVVVAFFTV